MKLPNRLPALALYTSLGLPTLALMAGCGSGGTPVAPTTPVTPIVQNTVSLATVAARPSGLSDSNIFTLYEPPSRTNLNGIDCGSVGQTNGCYGQEIISSLNVPGALVRGVPSQQGNVVTRKNYVMSVEDPSSPSNVSLTIVNATQTIANSSDTVLATNANTIPLPNIIGGASVIGFLDASSTSVFAATNSGPNVEIVDKASGAVTNMPFSGSNVSTVSTDREDFTSIVSGLAASSTSVVFNAGNTQVAQANGIIVTPDTRNGELFTNAAGAQILVCDQTTPTTTCHALAPAGTFGSNFKIIGTEPVAANGSLSRQFVIWSVDKQALFIITQTDAVTNGTNTDTISPPTVIAVTTAGGAALPLLDASDKKISFGATNDSTINAYDIATHIVTTLNKSFAPTFLPNDFTADESGNFAVGYSGGVFVVYDNSGNVLEDGGGSGFFAGTNKGVSFTTSGIVIPAETQPLTIRHMFKRADASDGAALNP